MSAHDPVNHPRHYNKHPSGVECIEVSECFSFNVGNALKYIWRAGEKGNEIEDLEKARWYLRREIESGGKPTVLVFESIEAAAKVFEVDRELLGCVLAIVVAANSLQSLTEEEALYIPLMRSAETLVLLWIQRARLSVGARGSQ